MFSAIVKSLMHISIMEEFFGISTKSPAILIKIEIPQYLSSQKKIKIF